MRRDRLARLVAVVAQLARWNAQEQFELIALRDRVMTHTFEDRHLLI
jgi:hypothetical protein